MKIFRAGFGLLLVYACAPCLDALVTSASTEALRPQPPQQPPPQWFVRSMRKMRGGGDMPLPIPLSRQGSLGVDVVSASKQKMDLGHLAFLFLGAGSLIPWNVVILAIDFFASVCPHYQIGQVASALALSNMLCNVGCLSMMVKFRMEKKIPVKVRVAGGLLVQCAAFCAVVCGSWFIQQQAGSAASATEVAMFKLIVLFGCLLGTTDSIVQGGLAGYASQLSPRYAQSLNTGQSLGGVLMVIVRVASKLSSGSAAGRSAEEAFVVHKLSARIFFAVAGLVVLACTHLFLRVDTIPSVADTLAAQRIATLIRSLSAETPVPSTRPPSSMPTLTLPSQSSSASAPASAPSRSAKLSARMGAARAQLGARLRRGPRRQLEPPVSESEPLAGRVGDERSARRPVENAVDRGQKADSGQSAAVTVPVKAIGPGEGNLKKGLGRRLRGCGGAVGFLFFVSVIAWPSLCSQIHSARPDPGGWFPVKMAAVWGLCELAGRKHAEGKIMSSRVTAAPIALRAAVIPVLIGMAKSSGFLGSWQDVAALAVVGLLSSTLGFFSSVMTAYAANKASVAEREWAGQFVQFSIAAGLASGSCAAYLVNRFLLH